MHVFVTGGGKGGRSVGIRGGQLEHLNVLCNRVATMFCKLN